MVCSAVVHQLTVIGEAVARLSPDVKDQHPEIPWTDIKGLRNVVVHNYFGIDWAEVWSAASTDVPVLRSQLLEILREYRETGWNRRYQASPTAFVSPDASGPKTNRRKKPGRGH